MANSDMKKLREKIDKIDSQILKLYEERMGVCEEIGQYKKDNGLPAYDEERENQKLDDVLSSISKKKYADGAAQLFLTLMQVSTEMQEAMIFGEDYFEDFDDIASEEDFDDFNWDGEPIELKLSFDENPEQND